MYTCSQHPRMMYSQAQVVQLLQLQATGLVDLPFEQSVVLVMNVF